TSGRNTLGHPADLAMKAVVICDDFAAVTDVAKTLARVGQQAGVNVQWATKSWAINALNDASLARKALLEAFDAHLILFPAQCAKSPPAWLFDWLSRWAALRVIDNAALGVIKIRN